MSPRPEYLHIRRLLDEPLRRFSRYFQDFSFDSLTEEMEKDILIALSQCFREVKQLTDEFDSDEELLPVNVDGGGCSIDSTTDLDDRHCVAEITGNLMFLLTINSRYARHLAENTLVAISEYLLILDGDWDYYMQLLRLSLELTICNSLSSSSDPGSLDSRYLDYDSSTSQLLKLKLKSANWPVVAAIFRVLRNIRKYLKQDSDNKIVKTYLDSLSSSFSNLPWDLLGQIYVGHNTEFYPQGSGEDILVNKVIQPRVLTMFFGNFIQFLCSLMSQSNFPEGGLEFSPLICRITNLVPRVTAWCHADIQSSYNVRISQYFRHKVLMLMVKLSSRTAIDHSISMTWIHLIYKYFEDLLLLPISGVKFDQDDFLEESPFSTSFFDKGKKNISTRHLQRLTIFLFLKCSLNLVGMKESSEGPQCAYENLKHYCSADLKLDSECCSKGRGLVKLHEWLHSHVLVDIFVNDELYFGRCMRFTKSFLQLFMHEDDILFKMLLQLFHVPFYPERQVIKDEPLHGVKSHMVFFASYLFNPVHLFHLFLAEIHYDHQVLLDYLISEDTGSSCAEYLLRVLRIVCDSWSLFVEFNGVQEDLGQLNTKRQKVLADCMVFKDVISSLDKGHKSHSYGSKSYKNYRIPSVAARDCLVSLTTSISSLNQKNLFPYNPKVLLRRLMRFQELCIDQQVSN